MYLIISPVETCSVPGPASVTVVIEYLYELIPIRCPNEYSISVTKIVK